MRDREGRHMDYEVVTCDKAPCSGRYYYLKNNKRRWITSIQATDCYGIDLRRLKKLNIDEQNKVFLA